MEKSIIRIVMERSHEEFTPDVRETFLRGLATLVGAARADLSEVIHGPGCVVIQIRLPAQMAARLLEAFAKANAGDDEARVVEVLQWIQQEHVAEVSEQKLLSVPTGLRTRRREQSVVLVHGWRGGQYTFGQLAPIIRKRLEVTCAEYDFPTAAVRESPSFMTISKNLDSWIRERADADRIALVAYSYGGHVVRDVLTSQVWRDDPLDKRVKQVTFIASPLTGSFLATLVKKIPVAGRVITNEQVKELSEHSPALVKLNDNWTMWTRKMVPTQCLVRSIYVPDDDVVGATSATSGDPSAVPVFGRLHEDVVAIEDDSDEVARKVLMFLQEARFGGADPAN